jgi:hypothetical protein
MKPITLQVYVSDDAPDFQPADSRRIKLAEIIEYLGAQLGYSNAYLLTDEGITQAANGIAAREYRDTVQGIVEDLKRAIRDGDVTDEDGASDWLHETVDGHHDVIYTSCAMEVCRQSRNDGAYFDDFGDEGAVSNSGIEWSKLAYCALLADVREAIGDLSEWFKCADCGGDVDADDLKVAGDDLPVCADCRDDDEDDEDTDGRERL